VLVDKHEVSAGYAGLEQTGFSVRSGQFPVPADGDGRDAVADPFGEAGNGGDACAKSAGNRSVIVQAGVEAGHLELPECLVCQTDIRPAKDGEGRGFPAWDGLPVADGKVSWDFLS